VKLPGNIKNLQIFSIIIPALFLFIIVYFLLLPSLKQQNLISQKIENKRADLGKVTTPTNEYIILREDLNKKKSQIKELKNKLFWERDIGKFLNELTRLASDLNIEFISLKPETMSVAQEEIKESGKEELRLVEIPITVVFKSSYNEIINFLKRVEEGKRFIRIDSLSIESEQNSIYKHTTRMKLDICVEKGG